MFIKLTKLDNRPVWLNASFIVTVEPRRDGHGAVVVPIGDGLDYDVKESPEDVLLLLEGAPAPTVVPVPVSDCLTKTPEDVSPAASSPAPAEPAPAPVQKPAAEAAAPAEGKKPRKRTVRKAKEAKEAKPAEPKAEEPKPSETQTEEPQAAVAATEEKPVESLPPVETIESSASPQLNLDADQIARLVKLAPKTLTKLKNTLVSQFHVADINETVQGLAAWAVFSIEGNRIVWPAAPAAS